MVIYVGMLDIFLLIQQLTNNKTENAKNQESYHQYDINVFILLTKYNSFSYHNTENFFAYSCSYINNSL